MTPEEFQHQLPPDEILRRIRYLQERRESGVTLSREERIELEQLEGGLELLARIKRRLHGNDTEPPPGSSG